MSVFAFRVASGPGGGIDRRLLCAIVAVAATHALLLQTGFQPAPGQSALDAAMPVTVRLVSPAPTPARAPAPNPSMPVSVPVEIGAAAPDAVASPTTRSSEAPAGPAAQAPVARSTPVRPEPNPSDVVASATLPPNPVAPAAAGPIGLPAAPDYAMSMRLDPGPQPLDDINPVYPEGNELRSGTVVLRVLISETGRVDEVAVVSAQPAGVFEKAAVAAFESARFAPGRLLGTPVKSQITIEVAFTPLNRGPRVSGRGY